MHRLIRNAVLIPVLFVIAALHGRTTRRRIHPLTSKGGVSQGHETRTRIRGAQVNVSRVNPNNPNRQVHVATDHNTTIPRKSDAELKADAQKLQAIYVDKFGPMWGNKKTVVCAQDVNGNLYYTTNKGGTDPDVRAEAEKMGYNRIWGNDTEKPGKDHAEQVMNNALEERKKADDGGYGDQEPYRSLPQGDPDKGEIRFVPDKQPCDDARVPDDPGNQGCRADSGPGLRW
jgi:hypothetical protein